MPGSEPAPNLLIVSDLHLGEDLRPALWQGRTSTLRRVVILERELEAFLNHYAVYRVEGRPWRLIVNGDMVDFLSVCLIPRADELDDGVYADSEPEDRVYGLGTRPRAARAKLRKVLERHPGVFRALARFLGAGNRLVIIAGNHDAEFHWPVVQEAFRLGVSSLWAREPAASRPDAATPADIEARIDFHPWFYFEEDLVWVEHGHQYDDYCSFEYVLNPVSASDEIVMNPGAAGMRYVVNHTASGGSHQEAWGAMQFVRWAASNGLGALVRIGRSYGAMARRLLLTWRSLARRTPGDARRRAHRERLRAWAARCKLSEDTLLALDNLRRSPVVSNFAKLVMAVFLDRLVLAVVAALLILTSVAALPWSWAVLAVLGVVAGTWATGLVVGRLRAPVDPIVKLKVMPELIRRHVRARFVVFGHAHDPVAQPLADGGWYFNTGTWVAAEKPGLLRAFTHLLIRRGAAGPQAVLCQWRDGESRAFTP